MLVGATLSLFTLDLNELVHDWREVPLGQLAGARPRGRASAAMRHPALVAADPALAPARAALPQVEARALFDALVEDRAHALVYDAPYRALAELFASLARAENLRSLDLSSLEAAPSAYPTELRPREPAGGLVVWPHDPLRLARAAETLAGFADSPPRAVEPGLWGDLVVEIAWLLSSTGPGMVMVAESP